MILTNLFMILIVFLDKNKAIFDLNDRKSYSQAIIYYIAGMTDNYAIDMYNKIVGF